MEQGFVDILQKLIAEQGKEALLGSKCKGLLADYTHGEYKKESRLLLQALDAGVQKAIDATEELAICKQQQVRVLREDYFLAEEVAVDVVDTLALVLRGDTSRTQVETTQPGTPKATPMPKAARQPAIAPSHQPALRNRSNAGRTGSTENQSRAQMFLDKGIMFAMRGDYDIAIEEFTEAIRVNPEMPTAYMLRGRALFASVSKVITVEGNFDNVLTVTPEKVSVEQIQIYDKAIEAYSRAIELGHNKAEAYIERGGAYADKGDFDCAIKDYNRAIRLDPNLAKAYIYRGTLYCAKGDYDKAIADYNQALRLKPNFADAYVNRGSAHMWKRDFDTAIVDYEVALRLDPNNAFIRQCLELARQTRR